MPTIYDVARHALVNASTVSRALNNPGRVNIKTEERVRSVATRLGYRPNPLAQGLLTGRTKTIGLVVADITNPMTFKAVRGAQKAADTHGYMLLLVDSQESGEREVEAVSRIAPSVDALVLVASRLPDATIHDLSKNKPTIVLNRHLEGAHCIVPDLNTGIDQALLHLKSLGHTSLAYLAGPPDAWMNQARWNQLFEKAPQHGMTILDIATAAPSLVGGCRAFSLVRSSGATAAIAYNDLMAIGLLRASSVSGARVPDDLSIIGFDDIFGADFTSPSLTTVRMPLGLAGERAVHRALDLIERADANLAELPPLPTELIVRGSTGHAASR